MNGPGPTQSICYLHCIRSFGYKPTLVFCVVEPSLNIFKKSSHFKAVNNTFTKTTTVLGFPLYFRQANIWSMKFA